jgi:hypothetical protein
LLDIGCDDANLTKILRCFSQGAKARAIDAVVVGYEDAESHRWVISGQQAGPTRA